MVCLIALSLGVVIHWRLNSRFSSHETRTVEDTRGSHKLQTVDMWRKYVIELLFMFTEL